VADNPHTGIRSIQIENFRGLESLSLDFIGPHNHPTQLVVIGGPNGSGKTTVLEACLIAAGYRGKLQGKQGKEAIRFGAADYRLAVVLQVGSDVRQAECDSESSTPALIPIVYFSSWRAPGLVGPIGITAGRRGRRPTDTERDRLWSIKQFFVNARAHELFPSPTPPGSQNRTRFETAISDLNRAWSLFYPKESFSVEPVADDPEAGFDVFLCTSEGNRLSVDLLSSGQIELFSFAGALVMEKMPQGLIVIDEPELHLDPQWHRQLLRALQILKPDAQILIGTHSPEVYESVRSYERHFLVPEDDPRVAAWRQDRVITGEVD